MSKTQGLAAFDGAGSIDDDIVVQPPLSSIRNLIIIALYNFANTFAQNASVMMIWYFNGYRLSYLYVSLAGLITTVVTTYVQIGVGYYGDKLQTRFGRRKPMVVAGNLLMLASMFVLAAPPSTEQNFLFVWAIIFMSILYSSYIISGNPYSSWIIESTTGPDDYTKIATTAAPIGTLLGALGGLALSFLLPHLEFCLLSTLLVVPTTILMVWLVPNPQLREAEKQPDIIPSLRTCMRSKEFKTIFINKILLFGGISIGLGMLTYLLIFAYDFIQYYGEILPYLFVVAVASIILILIVQVSMNCVLRKFDKLRVYKVCTFLAGLFSILVFIVTLPGIGKRGFFLLVIIDVILAGIVSALALIDGLFVRDLVVFDTFVTGLRRENMYQMALNLPSGLAISIGSNIPMIVCYMTGFVAGTNHVDDDHVTSKFIWNDTVIWEMRIYGSFLVALICYLSYYTIKNYPLNDKVARKISDIVIKRDAEAKADENSDFKTAVHAKDIEVTAAVAEPEDVMFMNNFSQVEIRAFSENIDLMESLKQKQVVGITLAMICIIILCAGTGLQLQKPQTSFAVLNISLALLLALYVGYELLRFTTLTNLMRMPSEDKIRLVGLARQSNEAYISKLGNMLKKSGIDDSGAGDVAPDSSEVRETLAQADPTIAEDLKDAAHLPGYKRLFTVFLCIIVYGIFGCTLLVYKSLEPHSHGFLINITVA